MSLPAPSSCVSTRTASHDHPRALSRQDSVLKQMLSGPCLLETIFVEQCGGLVAVSRVPLGGESAFEVPVKPARAPMSDVLRGGPVRLDHRRL